MRFSLIDRITALEPGRSVTAVKTLTRAEEYLLDHFPGFPVMPGVLMVEAMVQASAWLVRVTEDFAHSTVTLREARAVKFNSFITPGQTLHVTSTLHKRGEGTMTFKASGERDGVNCVSARLTLDLYDLGAIDPTLAPKDDAARTRLRTELAELWKG